MALRQYRPDDYQYDDYIPREKQATYQTYQVNHAKKERLRELLFFVNITLFSIITVLSSYIYLSLKVPTFLAFLLAIATGALGLKIIQMGIRFQLRKNTSRKK